MMSWDENPSTTFRTWQKYINVRLAKQQGSPRVRQLANDKTKDNGAEIYRRREISLKKVACKNEALFEVKSSS